MAILVEIINAESGNINKHKLFTENKVDFNEVFRYVEFHDAVSFKSSEVLFNVYVIGQCCCGKHEHHKVQVVYRCSGYFTKLIVNELWMTTSAHCFGRTERLADELVGTLENYDYGFILEYVEKTGEIPIREVLKERAVIDFRCTYLSDEVIGELYEAGFVNVIGYYIKSHRNENSY